MTTKYSSARAMKPLTIEDGDTTRIYKGQKLAAHTLLLETLKIIKTLLPAGGALADNFNQEDLPQTFTAAAQMLQMHLTEEHLEDLVMKLTGELVCNGEAIADWEAHFDKYVYDLPDVIAWAGEENFYDFFTRNHLVRSWIKKMGVKVAPLRESLMSLIPTESVNKNSDTNEKNGSDT